MTVNMTATTWALRHAERLLEALSYLAAAAEDGGQASELHLYTLRSWTVELLHEVGGFDEVIARCE